MNKNKTCNKEVDVIINNIENIKKQFLDDLNTQLEFLQNLQPVESKPNKKKEWRPMPEIGEQYFWIQNNGEIAQEYWDNDEYLDKELYQAGNCFPCSVFSREEVQQILLRSQLISLLTQYAIINNALASKSETEDCNTPLYWQYGHKDEFFGDKILVQDLYSHYPLVTKFNDEEIAKKAIADVVRPFLDKNPEFIW